MESNPRKRNKYVTTVRSSESILQNGPLAAAASSIETDIINTPIFRQSVKAALEAAAAMIQRVRIRLPCQLVRMFRKPDLEHSARSVLHISAPGRYSARSNCKYSGLIA